MSQKLSPIFFHRKIFSIQPSLQLVPNEGSPWELSLSETSSYTFTFDDIVSDIVHLAKLPPTILLNDFLNESSYLGHVVDKEAEEEIFIPRNQ